MKINIRLLLAATTVGLLSLTSCEDEPDKYEVSCGTPRIDYIRCLSSEVESNTDTEETLHTNGQLVVEAGPQSTLCLVGDNLRSITEMYFNDLKAVLNSSYITDNTLIVSVPKDIPAAVTDKIYMITSCNDTVAYDFHVVIPAPQINTMSCEYAKPGEEVTLVGRYMIDDPNTPLTVTFKDAAGNAVNAEIAKISPDYTSATVIVPETAAEGKIKVTSIYGEIESSFRYKDSRGLITNFDGENNSGTKGIVPQGWNLAVTYSQDGGVDGYYAQVGPTDLAADGGWTEALKISWWCGNWNGDPMSIKEGAGVPLRYLFPEGYFSEPEKLALKFELFIPSSNPWKAGAMQVLFVNNKQCANDSWQNNTYIHTKADGGLDLCRGLYRPWTETGSFDTGDKWITVTMPLSDFIYNMDGSRGDVALSAESFDSFTIWPVSGGVEGEDCTPLFRYDNIRIVPLK